MFKTCFSAVIFLRMCLGVALAQTTDTATISGTVADTTHARIAGAEVRAHNTLTGFERIATSNAQGQFTLPGLPIAGTYEVTAIKQDGHKVTATYVDTKTGGTPTQVSADWCLCTIPASVLSQIPMNVGAPMKNAINQIPYMAALKVGLQMKRRFWEQDEQIYGGVTYTNQPNTMIGYPQWDFFSKGKGVLLGSYCFGTPAYIAAAKPPEERIKDALEYGAKIHPQYKDEFECGVAVAWHRVPWTLGCAGFWTEESRAKHYDNLCTMDGRIVLAGEHASRIPAWQEGAVTSALDAITRLHKKAMSA